jgi:signal transduction histidine kinase
MSIAGKFGRASRPRFGRLALVVVVLAVLSWCPTASAAGSGPSKLVVVVYPSDYDGAPGIIAVNRALRSTFASQWSGHIDIRNEYVNTARLDDDDFMQAQVSLLQRKYAGRRVDLVIAGLSAGLDFAVKFREELFPGVPIVFVAVDEREVKARRLPPDVIGVPIRMDLTRTCDLALRLHPDTRRVFVVAGSSPFDAEWVAEARRTFRVHEDRVEFVYLTGLPMDELLERVANLPEQSLIYFLHLHRDSTGKPFYSAEVLERIAARANAPIYGHVDTYVGRGAVGGRVFRFEEAGYHTARLGLRILAGESPQSISLPEGSENADVFDWRQLRRWGIRERALPPGSVVLFREPSFWDSYRWYVIGGLAICAIEALLIATLLMQLVKRRRAERELRASQRQLQHATGRLLEAQEAERRRIARELHDDINQSLALLSVELDFLAGTPAVQPDTAKGLRELSTQVKTLSSSVHALSHQLHPSKLEQLGLVAAVRGLCSELKHTYGLAVNFTHDGVPGHLPAGAALCLYRIVQEALRNVIRHSGTNQATVELCGAGGMVVLRVADDGVGFDPVATNGGLGLVSMRERLHLVGGEIKIDSRPSGGTRIDVHIPLTAPATPANNGSSLVVMEAMP